MKRKPAPGMTYQGVRNLDDPSWKKTLPVPKSSKPIDPLALQDEPLHDLIYEHQAEIQEEILSVWPDAKLTPTYDDIHEWRTEVDIPKCSRLNWYKFLVRTGLARVSFCFQISMYKEIELIETAMDAESPGWRTRAKADRVSR